MPVSLCEPTTADEVRKNNRKVRDRLRARFREQVCLMKDLDLDNTTLAPPPNDSAAAKFEADQTVSEPCAIEMILMRGPNSDHSIDPNWGQIRPPRSSVKVIRDFVADFYGIEIPELLSHRRHITILWPRQAIALLAKRLTTRSLPEIGRILHRDHSSIIHSIRRAEYLIAHDPERADEVEYLHGILAATSSSAQ